MEKRDLHYQQLPVGEVRNRSDRSEQLRVIVGNHLSGDKGFGFFYANGVFKNIVDSGANYTMAGGINNNGLISGEIFLTGKTLGYTAVCK